MAGRERVRPRGPPGAAAPARRRARPARRPRDLPVRNVRPARRPAPRRGRSRSASAPRRLRRGRWADRIGGLGPRGAGPAGDRSPAAHLEPVVDLALRRQRRRAGRLAEAGPVVLRARAGRPRPGRGGGARPGPAGDRRRRRGPDAAPARQGEDRYGAGPELCDRIAEAFHPAQTALAKSDLSEIKGRFDPKRVRNVAEPYFDKIDGLAALVDDLPARLAAADECGLPDTLVHGDLYPGNVRTDAAGHLTILDWGDCIVGNPAFDILRLTDDLDDPEPVLDAWAYRWAKSVPGSRPQRAVELLRPVAALRNAVAYADFLDRIEPSEWPYHARDVPESLAAALL
ncbi:phosphotransferase family protein [Paractinoplanes durhamensis]|uniref:phosphotransferase family protein n=1 Tax=Paractinoplanes durhamensis TaxID=113563 RepID=UPI0036453433